MQIDKSLDDGILTLKVAGRLDTNTAADLEAALSLDGASGVVFDFSELEYISSAGLRVLLSTQKKTKGNMRLKNVCELVMEVFELTGFADILVIE